MESESRWQRHTCIAAPVVSRVSAIPCDTFGRCRQNHRGLGRQHTERERVLQIEANTIIGVVKTRPIQYLAIDDRAVLGERNRLGGILGRLMCRASAKVMTYPVPLTVSWLELLHLLRHQDFQEKSLLGQNTDFQSRRD